MYNICFVQKEETHHNFHLKIIIFTAVRYCSMLNKHVIVMATIQIYICCINEYVRSTALSDEGSLFNP